MCVGVQPERPGRWAEPTQPHEGRAADAHGAPSANPSTA